MKSFGWKRKVGEKVDHTTQSAFESDANAGDDREQTIRDWMKTAAKIRSVVSLDERMGDVEQVIKQGAALAEAGNYIASLKKLDAAGIRCPDDERIHEMKAQVLLIMDHTEDSIETAQQSVACRPNWWIALQTLGRAHLNNGDLTEALKAFSKAVHLNPAHSELWKEDLYWAKFLLLEKEKRIPLLTTTTDVEMEESTPPQRVELCDIEDDNDLNDDGVDCKLVTMADMNSAWFNEGHSQTECESAAGYSR